MKKEEIKKELFDYIIKNPDSYTEFISVCSLAWSNFKKEYDQKQNALILVMDKLITKEKAVEMIKNRETEGYLNLDMFQYFEDELVRIISKK